MAVDMRASSVPSAGRGARRDVLAGGSLWATAAVAVGLIEGLSVPARLAIVAAAAAAVVTGISARHIRRLTARLTDAAEREAALVHHATHDPLTGLANRALLFERLQLDLQRLRRSGGAVLVAYLDVDNLKVVNDTFGHGAGDRVLLAAAYRLTSAVREVDTVARIGGDEFLVVCSVDDAAVADRLIARLTAATTVPSHPHGEARLSLGWVVTHDPDADPIELMAQADTALYRAKARRRGEDGSTRWPSPITS